MSISSVLAPSTTGTPSLAQTEPVFPYVFRWDRTPRFNGKPVQRRRQRCRIVVWGKKTDGVMIRFEDGFEMVTTRRAIVRAPQFKDSRASAKIR